MTLVIFDCIACVKLIKFVHLAKLYTQLYYIPIFYLRNRLLSKIFFPVKILKPQKWIFRKRPSDNFYFFRKYKFWFPRPNLKSKFYDDDSAKVHGSSLGKNDNNNLEVKNEHCVFWKSKYCVPTYIPTYLGTEQKYNSSSKEHSSWAEVSLYGRLSVWLVCFWPNKLSCC